MTQAAMRTISQALAGSRQTNRPALVITSHMTGVGFFSVILLALIVNRRADGGKGCIQS
jgi:hypothetical protein